MNNPIDLSAGDVLAEIAAYKTRIENLESVIVLLTENNCDLSDRISALEDAMMARSRKEFEKHVKGEEKLEEYKRGFMEKRPFENDGADFTNVDLVLWASYVLKDTPRREKVNYTELFKRLKRINAILKFFKEWATDRGQEEAAADLWAKKRTKQFIEYMLRHILVKGEHLNFWQATSDWAINNYHEDFATWQTLSKYDDKPLEI